MTALLYEIIYVCVVSAGLLSFFAPLFGLESLPLPALLITMAVACIIPVLRRSGWTVRLIVSGILIALGVAAAFLLRSEAVREFLSGYSDYIYLPLIALGGLIIGEALVYIKPLKVVVSFALIAYMIWACVTDRDVDKIMLLSVSAMLIITIIEVMQAGWKKAGDTDNKKHLVYVFCFVVTTLTFIVMIPAPDDPYDWKFVKNIAHAAYELILDIERKLTSSDVYDPTSSSIGFSGRGEIVGNVAHQNDEVLELCDLTTNVKAVRLSGKSFDTFDGRVWYSNDPSEQDDSILDTLAFLASVSEYSDVPDDFAKRLTFRIEYSALRSEFVFVPLKSLVGPDGTDGKEISFVSGDMVWGGSELPEQYYLTYYRINIGNPAFREFLKNASAPEKESYDLQIADTSMTGEQGISYDDYLAYTDHVREYYTQAPVLSDELRSYMDKVYEGCEDDIDKADRLCELLKSFEYTNTPGALPEYVTDPSSMLDYFMLESRRGYCTHFATAFVLLARAEGIPARFVQGYYVPTGGARNVTVYTYMAHAWPEIYVEGAGWITYEPTPGYGYGSYWLTKEQTSDMYGNIGEGYEEYHGDEDEDITEEIITEEIPEEEKAHIPWYVIVIPVSSGIAFVILFILAGNLIVSFAHSRKAASEKYRILCRQIFGLLDLLEMGTKPGETLKEYGERIREDAGDEIDAFIGNLTLFLYAEGADVEKYEKQAYFYRKTLLVRLRKERFIKYLTYYLGFQKVKNGKTVDNA